MFSVSGQDDDYVDYVYATYASDSSFYGVTSLHWAETDSTPVATQYVWKNSGPWVNSSASLFSKAFYKVDPVEGIQPKNPDNNPGESSRLSVNTAGIFTIPSTDEYYYNPPFSGSFPPDPSPVTTGGAYATIGVLHDGSLGFSLAQFRETGISAVWPSAPMAFSVDYVSGYPNLTTVGAFEYPNPPPPYTAGVYSVIPDPSGHDIGYYKSGGPPVPDNAYTGIFPQIPQIS